MSLVLNETLKLQAGALDRASTACVTVGVIAPLAASVYSVPAGLIQGWLLPASLVIWFFAGLALHIAARRTLRGLKS